MGAVDPFKALVVSSLSVRVVVKFGFRPIYAEGDAPDVHDRACRSHPQ